MPIGVVPTLGDQVILLINAYRNKLEFPYALTLCGDYGDSARTELRDWWEKERKKIE